MRRITRLCSLTKLLYLRCIYGSGFSVPALRKLRIGKYLCINIGKGAALSFAGTFECRNFVNLKITSGTLSIGDGVFFNNGVSINCHTEITIGAHSIFGESVKLYDHNHQFSKPALIKDQGYTSGGIVIGENVWVGSNVLILQGVSIGNNCVIGAGCIICESIPEQSIVTMDRVLTVKPITR